jgi:hypothetical protein
LYAFKRMWRRTFAGWLHGGRCWRLDIKQVFGGLPALAVRVGGFLRVSGRLHAAVHDPLGSEDHQRTPRADAPDQLGQRCSSSYVQGAVFGSDEADE